MSWESDLLDSLEDAQEQIARVRRQLKIAITLTVSSVASIIVTVVTLSYLHVLGYNLGAVGAINFLFGIMALCGAVATGDTWFEELPPARKQLKKAERAHRNFMIER